MQKSEQPQHRQTSNKKQRLIITTKTMQIVHKKHIVLHDQVPHLRRLIHQDHQAQEVQKIRRHVEINKEKHIAHRDQQVRIQRISIIVIFKKTNNSDIKTTP